ncbi:hypothetical protein SO802_017352 [Lithocarpus litseifolius]|uniref:Serine/threonine-protein kinase BSK1-like TPR repeats domain-containing protein n=1 Tax=Lithocarpus litseifolius TaxID=425828 RepID=A0AAW2D2X0_9ROSI
MYSYTVAGNKRILRLLISKGGKVDAISNCGTPLHNAAAHGKKDSVRILFENHANGAVILFPVTSRIPAILDWSNVGIMKYIHSEEATRHMNRKLKENFLTLKSKGEDAFKRKDYLGAICWYTEAINADPSDATVLSNRSLCWTCLNEGSRALSDAEACIALRPDRPKAYYREGVAYKLLKDFVKSAYSFNEALELDPKNEDLQKAFWEAVVFVIR